MFKMGRQKKINKKKKEVVNTLIDNSETSKIKLDFNYSKEKYDDCNQLVLPSKKRPTKKLQNVIKKSSRILSKSQRKKLEKVLDKKKKKENRSTLLEALAKVQAPEEKLNEMSSIALMQTTGLKRHFIEIEKKKESDILDLITPNLEKKDINSISGSKRRKRIIAAILSKNSTPIAGSPNVVGFENSESSDFSDSNESILNKNENTENSITIAVTEDKNAENSSRQNLIQPNLLKSSNTSEEVKIEEKKIFEKNKEFSDLSNISTKTELFYKSMKQPAVFVYIDRKPQIQNERLKLPILAEEQIIMEAINENNVVIIVGETGSGKTTQVPQFLYEAGYAKNEKIIGITQPRRVAAISMSKRVAEEMNLDSDVVSYLIRFEGNVSENTKLKFMTDGVLLKEVQSDFLLSKYSVIILDEAHERNICTDILIGLLSRIVPLRAKHNDPLKLIIMSATLRIEDFTENLKLFKTPPPVIQVDARQHPVTIYFNKKTSDNYIKDSFLKTCKIHTKLPEGGILIFVTGQNEVNYLVKKLKQTFPFKQADNISDSKDNLKQSFANTKKLRKKKCLISDFEINLDKYAIVPNDDTELELLESDNEYDILNEEFNFSTENLEVSRQPLWVLPMYSLLPSAKQAQVFSKPPAGCRLCVVSTNVAETSLTIPNIKYVVDSGKTKIKLYDKITGVTTFRITWCSKASANQRAGRAGRIGPGHCYRLYSSAVFNDEFPKFSTPEILQKPIDDLILQMKVMNIIKVINFPFPTSPDIEQLKSGEKRLRILGALEEPSSKKEEWSSKLSKLGETMASFPVAPRFAKMLALSYQHNILQYMICIVSALSVPEVLLNDVGEKKWSIFHRNWAGVGNSLLLGDVMVLLRAMGAAEFSKSNLEEFCLKNGLRYKAMCEIRKLRAQLINQINLSIPELNLVIEPNLIPPNDTEAKLLRQILLAGLADHIAHKVNLDEIKNLEDKRIWKKAYKDSEIEDPVFLHSSSVLKAKMPEWIVYQEIYETNKLYLRGVTAIEPEWLPIFVPSLCHLSEPLLEPPPRYDHASGKIFCHVNGTFGRAAFILPTMEIPLSSTLMSYKWFAKFFLEGEVFPKMKKYKEILLSAPAVMTKSWAKLQPRTQVLLSALVTKEANNKNTILNIWESEPFYLLEAFKAWLPESAHESIMSVWPPR